MKLDKMRTHGVNDTVDVVVVGTGAGGAPLLAMLAAKGLSVVALEAGRNFEPGEHTPDEMEGSDINWMEERLSGGDTRRPPSAPTIQAWASAARRCTGAPSRRDRAKPT